MSLLALAMGLHHALEGVAGNVAISGVARCLGEPTLAAEMRWGCLALRTPPSEFPFRAPDHGPGPVHDLYRATQHPSNPLPHRCFLHWTHVGVVHDLAPEPEFRPLQLGTLNSVWADSAPDHALHLLPALGSCPPPPRDHYHGRAPDSWGR